MQAIGTAGLSAAGRYVATAAAAPGMLLAGGATPAAGAAPIAAPAGASAAQDGPAISLELVAPTLDELAGAHALAGRSSLPIEVADRTPSVEDVIRNLDQPVVETSRTYVGRRDKLREQLRNGQGDPTQIVRRLDDLDVIIRMLERAEEKKRLMKELIRKLMLGLLTPELISKAKAAGLIEFLQAAIKKMIKSGAITSTEAKAMSVMLAVAGIRVPELDALVQHQERQQQLEEVRSLDATRAARGLQPSIAGLSASGNGTAGPGTAVVGAQALGLTR